MQPGKKIFGKSGRSGRRVRRAGAQGGLIVCDAVSSRIRQRVMKVQKICGSFLPAKFCHIISAGGISSGNVISGSIAGGCGRTGGIRRIFGGICLLFRQKLGDPGIGIRTFTDRGTENAETDEKQGETDGKTDFVKKMKMTVVHGRYRICIHRIIT